MPQMYLLGRKNQRCLQVRFEIHTAKKRNSSHKKTPHPAIRQIIIRRYPKICLVQSNRFCLRRAATTHTYSARVSGVTTCMHIITCCGSASGASVWNVRSIGQYFASLQRSSGWLSGATANTNTHTCIKCNTSSHAVKADNWARLVEVRDPPFSHARFSIAPETCEWDLFCYECRSTRMWVDVVQLILFLYWVLICQRIEERC